MDGEGPGALGVSRSGVQFEIINVVTAGIGIGIAGDSEGDVPPLRRNAAIVVDLDVLADDYWIPRG